MKCFKFPTAILLITGFAMSGCSNNANTMFKSPLSNTPTTIAPAAPATGPATTTAPAPAVPYVLSAQSAGQFIDFTIYNLGSTDLAVKKEDFAVLAQDSREITPYDKASAVIDLPQPAVVKPNETLKGRAVFHKVSTPTGRRLVFKPDSQGTFADIGPAVQTAR